MFGRIESYIAQLQADPVGFLITMAYTWGVILFSLILHECAHGYMALKCGDPTAKMLGRLSLNPARHLDPFGTLCMFLLGFGWAKPVPVNPRNFRNYRRDDLLVSIAGVSVNLTIFMLAVLLSCVLNRVMMGQETLTALMEAYDVGVEPFVSPFYNVGGYVMDGDWEALEAVLQAPWLLYVQRGLLLLAQVNLTLALFNLLPIPPLDGFHVVNDILLKGKLQLNYRMHQLTHVALTVLLLTGALNKVLSIGVSTVYEAVLRSFLMLTGQM